LFSSKYQLLINLACIRVNVFVCVCVYLCARDWTDQCWIQPCAASASFYELVSIRNCNKRCSAWYITRA